jgi:hypothetical protein
VSDQREDRYLFLGMLARPVRRLSRIVRCRAGDDKSFSRWSRWNYGGAEI